MATDLTSRIVRASNLFEPNEVFNLPRPRGFMDPVAAVSFVTLRPSVGVGWGDVLSTSIDAAQEYIASSMLRDRRWLFFAANDTWRTTSSVTRYKGFWGVSGLAKWDELPRASKEVGFISDGKVRYAVSAELRCEDVFEFGNWIRSTQSGLMFLEDSINEQTEAQVRDCYADVFAGGQIDVDWGRAIGRFCKSDSILVRFSGSFDDPDGSVDLFYNPRFVGLP